MPKFRNDIVMHIILKNCSMQARPAGQQGSVFIISTCINPLALDWLTILRTKSAKFIDM